MVDTVGNRLGKRAAFDYKTDSQDTVLMQQDESVGLAVGNIKATVSQRPTSVNGKYLSGRYVLLALKSDPTVTKSVVIGDPLNTLFAADSTQDVTINGVVWVTTGRVGEKVSFLRVDAAAPAPTA